MLSAATVATLLHVAEQAPEISPEMLTEIRAWLTDARVPPPPASPVTIHDVTGVHLRED